MQFNDLRMGHHLLLSYSFKFGLNYTIFCTLHLNECLFFFFFFAILVRARGNRSCIAASPWSIVY